MPFIPYNPTVPQATDEPSDSQPALLQNSAGVNTWTIVDHYEFASSNAGKHKQVTLPVLGANPAALANEGVLFTKQDTDGNNNLYYKRGNNGSVVDLTGGGAAAGFAFLPNGVLLKWGNGSVTGYDALFTFPAGPGIPVFTTISSIIITGNAATNSLNAKIVTAGPSSPPDGTKIHVSAFLSNTGVATTSTFNYFVIGT